MDSSSSFPAITPTTTYSQIRPQLLGIAREVGLHASRETVLHQRIRSSLQNATLSQLHSFLGSCQNNVSGMWESVMVNAIYAAEETPTDEEQTAILENWFETAIKVVMKGMIKEKEQAKEQAEFENLYKKGLEECNSLHERSCAKKSQGGYTFNIDTECSEKLGKLVELCLRTDHIEEAIETAQKIKISYALGNAFEKIIHHLIDAKEYKLAYEVIVLCPERYAHRDNLKIFIKSQLIPLCLADPGIESALLQHAEAVAKLNERGQYLLEFLQNNLAWQRNEAIAKQLNAIRNRIITARAHILRVTHNLLATPLDPYKDLSKAFLSEDLLFCLKHGHMKVAEKIALLEILQPNDQVTAFEKIIRYYLENKEYKKAYSLIARFPQKHPQIDDFQASELWGVRLACQSEKNGEALCATLESEFQSENEAQLEAYLKQSLDAARVLSHYTMPGHNQFEFKEGFLQSISEQFYTLLSKCLAKGRFKEAMILVDHVTRRGGIFTTAYCNKAFSDVALALAEHDQKEQEIQRLVIMMPQSEVKCTVLKQLISIYSKKNLSFAQQLFRHFPNEATELYWEALGSILDALLANNKIEEAKAFVHLYVNAYSEEERMRKTQYLQKISDAEPNNCIIS